MKKLCFALLLSGTFVVAQDTSASTNRENSKDSSGQVTAQGCVSKSNGDYVLMKQNPAITYELQATNKIRLSHYLGQRVEVVGSESPSMSTSSDSMTKTGSPSPVTLTITSIKTIDKECTTR